MYPDSYNFLTRGSVHGSLCCVSCSRLDAKSVATEPHGHLLKTGEDQKPNGRLLHYSCNTCGAEWRRYLKDRTSGGTGHYWELMPAGARR